MNIKKQLLMAAAFLGTFQIASAADITGKVTLKGAPPTAPDLPFDVNCAKLHTEPKKMPFYVVASDGGLADVFVYIKDGLSGKTFEVPAQPGVIDQKGCEYVPYVSGLQTKQKLLVKNSDPAPILHNVHPMPNVPGNKESNRAQMAGMQPFEYAFDNPEMFLKYKCDVHGWMFSYVSVLDHSFYAVTGKDGTFTIKNVPPGKYTVEAVHRKTHPNGKGIPHEVTVGADGAKVDFVIELK